MNLFVCNGECLTCTVNIDCPYKNDREFHERLVHNQLMELLRTELLDSQSLIEIIEDKGHSLFNSINAWDITKANMSQKDIKQSIISWLPHDLTEDMPTEVVVVFQKSIAKIAQKISDVLRGKCINGECFGCILREHCPQMSIFAVES